MDLYLEQGTLEDLKAIFECYINAGMVPFLLLDQQIVDSRNFSEMLWYLLAQKGQTNLLCRYMIDWACAATGGNSIATSGAVSLVRAHKKYLGRLISLARGFEAFALVFSRFLGTSSKCRTSTSNYMTR